MKNTLMGDRTLMPELEIATVRIEFLRKMIPLIRGHQSQFAKLVDAYLVIDFLKWNLDVGSMSRLKRTIARKFAKADPEYKNPLPPELTA